MNPAHLTNLKKLCEQIEAGYAANKSGLDDDMVPLLVELADETALIKELIELGAQSEPFGTVDDLMAALAEQAEPVAWSPRLPYAGYEAQRVWANGKPRQEDIDYWQKNGLGIDLAFAAPPAPARQEPLTEEQIDAVCKDSIAVWVSAQPGSDLHKFARAIERAHGITAAPAEGGAA